MTISILSSNVGTHIEVHTLSLNKKMFILLIFALYLFNLAEKKKRICLFVPFVFESFSQVAVCSTIKILSMFFYIDILMKVFIWLRPSVLEPYYNFFVPHFGSL